MIKPFPNLIYKKKNRKSSSSKITPFEEEKVKLMDKFIEENKSNFKNENLVIIGKLKK